jgi:electron transfer flavoprotein alpha subunit
MTEEVVVCYSEEPVVAEGLVRLARSLTADGAGRVRAAVLPGSPPDAADRLAAAGAHAVDTLAGPSSSDPHVVAETLRAAVAELSPTLILLGSTKRGREVAGRLAGALDLPAATGVTALRLEGDGIRVDREALSGNAVAVERIVRRPAIVAVMPGTAAPPPSVVAGAERHQHAVPPIPPLTERAELRPKAGGQLEIEKAERIVTIGRGLKKKEDLGIIEALARALGAEVGCTRPLAAESGWLTDDHWIGLTGHRVHPTLYVAVGVSGAVQHLVGMRSSKVVVAINKDPNAPIFSQADYRITGDLYQLVPAITKAFGG